MSQLLLADDIGEEVEQGGLPFPVDKDTLAPAGLESTVQMWLPDNVHTSPEVADVIEKLPWWTARSMVYIIGVFVLAVLTWTSFATFDVVAVASGSIVPQGNIKSIQPASSGIVQNVFVKEGDKVEVGEAIIQLDAAQMRTRVYKLRQELETCKSQLRLMMVNRPISDTLEQQNKIARLQTEIGEAERMLRYTTVTSPVSGIVTTLSVRGAGEVLQQGQTIATIAPSEVPLVVEALLPNKDIAFVKKGLPAKLKLEALPFQDYGVVEGTVIDVSADAISNKDGVSNYKVTIAPSTTHIATQEGDVTLRPGLSVSAEIITERRTVLSLLLEPARRLKHGIS